MAYEAYLRGRVPALITAFLAVLSIIISFIALLSTSREFPLEQFSIVTIDASIFLRGAIGADLGQALTGRDLDSKGTIVEIAQDGPAVPAPAPASVFEEARSAPSDAKGVSSRDDGTGGTTQAANASDLFGFGGRGGGNGGGTTGGTGTGGTTGGASGTGSTTGTGTDFPAKTFLGDMQLIFNNIFGAARGNSRIATGFRDQLDDFFGDITDNFGLQNFYAFYMSSICDGQFFNQDNNDDDDDDNDDDNNDSNSNNGAPLLLDTFECIRYTSLTSTSFGGSDTFSVGGSILDFGNFNFLRRFADGRSGFNSIFVTIFVLQILGLLCLFLLLLLSGIYVCIRVRILSIAISTFVFLAFVFFLAVAVLVTSANVFITSLVNTLFDGIGLKATGGGPLLALLWSNVVLVLLSLFVWFAKWHQSSFVRRTKEKGVFKSSLGGGKAFPASFFKKKKSTNFKGSAANTVEPTPIHETYATTREVEDA